MTCDPFGWVGRIIDAKYRVESVVDEGPNGVVYRAHHRHFEEPVALKCLKVPPDLKGEAREACCHRFLAEGRFLYRLSRANAGIIQALDVGTEPASDGAPVPYLVLEWLEGVSLAEDLERRAQAGAGGRTLDAAIALLEPAASALASAHAVRVAHCDVKPANLFLTQVAGRITLKVLDFGIARALTEGAEPEPASEGDAIRSFSARYAAPEQFAPRYGRVGPHSDVFALALVLVEVVSGRRALEGDDLVSLLRASANPLERPSLRARGVHCSDQVEEVVRRALSVAPTERFATARDFWQALVVASRAVPRLPQEVRRHSNGAACSRRDRPVDAR